MKIGLIGAGAIANFLLTEINQNNHDKLQITSVFVRNKEKYQALEEEFGITLFTDLDHFLDSDIDIVAEAATVEATENSLPKIIKKKDLVLISIGALVDETNLKETIQLAETHQHNNQLPDGATGDLDLIKNAQTMNTVDRVLLTTRKPADSITDEKLEQEKTIFEGTAKDAIKQFPKNINVSIVLSLAGLGIEKTNVRIIADPELEQNIHQVEITGDFGEANFEFKNNPLPSNPKTSYLAAVSVLGTLERLGQSIKIE